MMQAAGDRIKKFYEDRTRVFLPRRTNTIVRVDGRSFANYTKNMDIPYDYSFMSNMDATAIQLCKELTGSVMAFVFSDEASILMTDYSSPHTEALFNGNLQKICSVSASIATATFNRERIRSALKADMSLDGALDNADANFDGRAFVIPDKADVALYFQWRQMDATRNSISMAARSEFSHQQLDGKTSKNMLDMLIAKGINWNNYPAGAKRGRAVIKQTTVGSISYEREGQTFTKENVERSSWVVDEPPRFTASPEYILNRIPEPYVPVYDTNIDVAMPES